MRAEPTVRAGAQAREGIKSLQRRQSHALTRFPTKDTVYVKFPVKDTVYTMV